MHLCTFLKYKLFKTFKPQLLNTVEGNIVFTGQWYILHIYKMALAYFPKHYFDLSDSWQFRIMVQKFNMD